MIKKALLTYSVCQLKSEGPYSNVFSGCHGFLLIKPGLFDVVEWPYQAGDSLIINDPVLFLSKLLYIWREKKTRTNNHKCTWCSSTSPEVMDKQFPNKTWLDYTFIYAHMHIHTCVMHVHIQEYIYHSYEKNNLGFTFLTFSVIFY